MPSLVVIRPQIKVKQRGGGGAQPIWFQKTPAGIGLRFGNKRMTPRN